MLSDKEYISQGLSHWSSCRSAINSFFCKIRDKCGRLGQNPSAKNGLVHFLLGAMLPCSTPFSTSDDYRHHLHGGNKSFDRLNWHTSLTEEGDGVVFSILSPHGSEVSNCYLKHIYNIITPGLSWQPYR